MLALDAFARNKMQFLTLVAFFGVLSLTAVSFRSKRGDDAVINLWLSFSAIISSWAQDSKVF